MPIDFTDEQVASTFKKLNASHDTSVNSRVGIYASWAALVLLAACFIVVTIFMLDADRRAESVRLQQSTDLIVQSVESRLLGTTELLQKTSMRLMHIPGAAPRATSAELAAIAFMQDRREVLDMSLVTRGYRLLRHWASPSQSTFIPDDAPQRLDSEAVRTAVQSVIVRDAPVITPPYTISDNTQVFVDLFVPTPSEDQVLVARINLSRLINDAANSVIGTTPYIFYFEQNGKPLVDIKHHRSSSRSLTYTTSIPLLNDPNLRLVSVSYEHSLLTTDNLKFWVIIALAGLLAVALALLLRTQRVQHRAHQRLFAENSLRVAMSDSALAGIRVTDREGRILFINETFEKLVGFRKDELLGIMPPYPYWEDDITTTLTEILGHPEERHVRSLEFRVRRSDGVIFDGQLNVSPMLNENRRVIGWIGELYDITEQKRARERMKAAHERFTRVVQSMNSAICVVSGDQDHPRLLFHNTPYERFFGCNTDGATRLMRLIAQKHTLMSREGVFDEDSNRWFDARIQWLTWTDDTPARMIIATDITNQRETELALEAQMKRAETTQRLVTMGEMASSLAHELNQPLAAISNYASGASVMIEAGKLSREDTLLALSKMARQAQRAAAIIKRIRGFAAAKKTDPQFTRLSPESVVNETMELALIQADKLKASINTVIEPNLPEMVGDSVMLEQLLLNLLKNAMEAVLPCPNHTIDLTVKLHETGNFIEFIVADHGPGIPDPTKALLFDAFYSTKDEGMGMGLNICRSIVEVHHGRIIITDTPGGGATFTFTVPLAREGQELM
ncbi:MAG: PAS domain S-box protein [Sutterella wadsworthensis]|nr:PAS domain S-box protein [Sutterella wadsworthensis]